MKLRPVEPSLEFRRAAAIEMLNRTSIISEPSPLALDKFFREQADKPRVGFIRHRISELVETCRYIGQRIFEADFWPVHRGDYFRCHRAQKGGKAVCIDGQGFRLIVGRHRLFLQVEGQAQHTFSLSPENRVAGGPDYAVPDRGAA